MFPWRKPHTPYGTLAWTSRQWVAYFRKNARRQPSLPWQHGAELTDTERRAVVASLQDFQLGESSAGRFLLAKTAAYAERVHDPDYLEAMRLFVAEEQRHGGLLAEYFRLADIPLRRHSKLDLAFRLIRRLAGLEWCIFVLVTAELIGRVYYRALRHASGSLLLRRICDQLLRDEVMHVRFHWERLARLGRRRRRWLSALTWFGRRLAFRAAGLFVWLKHRRALRAGGLTWAAYWRHCGEELTLLRRKTRVDSYQWRSEKPRLELPITAGSADH